MVARETSLSDGLSHLGISATNAEISRLAFLADLLENQAVNLGFLGPNEGPRVVSRHLLDSAALIPLLPSEGPVFDVGSGAGLPGLVLAILGRQVVLVDSQARRVDFLRETIDHLEIDASVLHGRAEDLGRGTDRETGGAAVARALATAPVALELCLPFVRPGGSFLLQTSRGDERRPPADRGPMSEADADEATEGPIARAQTGPVSELRPRTGGALRGSSRIDSADRLDLGQVSALLGGGEPRWLQVSVPGADSERWVMIVDKLRPTPDRFPRRPGVPKRRPLGGDVASVN